MDRKYSCYELMAWARHQPDLKYSQQTLLFVLVSFANENGKCWPSNKTLGYHIGMLEKHVRRALAELRAFGLIGISGRGHTRSLTLKVGTIYQKPAKDCPIQKSKFGAHEQPTNGATFATNLGHRTTSELPKELNKEKIVSLEPRPSSSTPTQKATPSGNDHQGVGKSQNADRRCAPPRNLDLGEGGVIKLEESAAAELKAVRKSLGIDENPKPSSFQSVGGLAEKILKNLVDNG